MVVGDRIRIGTGYSEYYDPNVKVFPDVTFVTGIGVSTLTISKTTTNIGIRTTIVEVGIQNCGIVTGINITYGGGGYLSPPTVTITNDTGEKNYIDQVLGVTTATTIVSVVGSSSTVESVYVIKVVVLDMFLHQMLWLVVLVTPMVVLEHLSSMKP